MWGDVYVILVYDVWDGGVLLIRKGEYCVKDYEGSFG